MRSINLLAFAVGAVAVLTAAGATARSERLCPMIYRPVCAINRYEHKQTFANRCEAENANAHVIHEGVCRHRRN
jgi:Kazal-type serine protease inhibitor domain